MYDKNVCGGSYADRRDKAYIIAFILICCFVAGCSVLQATKKEHDNVIEAKDDINKNLLIRDIETSRERVFHFVPIYGSSSGGEEPRDCGGMFQYDLLHVGDTIKIKLGHPLKFDQFYYNDKTLLTASDFHWRVMDKKDIKHRQDSIKHRQDSIKSAMILEELKQQMFKNQRYTK